MRFLIGLALAGGLVAGIYFLQAREVWDEIWPAELSEAEKTFSDDSNDDEASFRDDDDDDDDVPIAVIEVVDGERVLTLPEDAAEASGFLSYPLARATWQERSTALGSVLDVSSLLEAVSGLRDAALRLRHSEERLVRLRERANRLETLHREHGSVRLMEVETATDAVREEEGVRESVVLERRQAQMHISHRWGETLAQHVRNDTNLIRRLESRESVLVQVPRPADIAVGNSTAEVVVDDEARPLESLGSGFAPIPGMADDAGLFLGVGAGLRPGLRVEVWFIKEDAVLEGVNVPGSAVVFHDGRSWVYVDLGDSRFVRRSLADMRRMERGWFVAGPSLAPAQKVVVRGAQTLLAEEFRARIMREDDD